MSPLTITNLIVIIGVPLTLWALWKAYRAWTDPYQRQMREFARLEEASLRRGCTQGVNRVRRDRQRFVHGGWRGTTR